MKTTPGENSARRLTAAEAAKLRGEGQRCGTRPCGNPVSVVTWRWFYSKAAGRLLLAERFVCGEHGEAFGRRYHVTIEDAPGGAP